MDREPRVLALDLSLTRSGWCGPQIANRGVLCPPYDSKQPEKRLEWIAEQVELAATRIGGRWPADVVVMEGFSFGSKGRALDQIHGLGWLVRMDLRDHGIPYVAVPPSVIKRYATGKGNADKQAMQMAATKRLGYDDDKPDDNVVDAMWLLALALDAYRRPVCQVPKAQRDASVAAVSWPRITTDEEAAA